MDNSSRDARRFPSRNSAVSGQAPNLVAKVQETLVAQAPRSLGLHVMGDFFHEGQVQTWAQVLNHIESHMTLPQLNYYRA